MNWGRLPKKILAGILGLTLVFGASSAQAEEVSQNSTTTNQTTNKPSKPERKIVINSASRLLTLYDGNKKVAMYPLGLGKASTPTPTGYYKILEKIVNPTWTDPSDPSLSVPSGPDNPLGYRWMQVYGNYGIHGTNRPDSIGYYVSNGCIRMLEENVEELFDAVEVNTPVEITYNRVVVEKADDDNVVYYIYPDGYGWQNVEVKDVTRWIEPYGVLPFVSDTEIESEILESRGEPNYIGKPYNIELNGTVLKQIEINGRTFIARAVIRDTIAYLPVVPIAVALNTKLEWRAAESTLKTAYGEVTGYEKRKQIYCNSDDAVLLFNIDGGLQNTTNGKIYRLRSITPPPEIIEPPIDKPKPEVDKPKPEEKPEVDKPKPEEKPNVDKPKPDDKPDVDKPKPEEKPNVDKPKPDDKPEVDKPTSRTDSKELDKPFDDQKSNSDKNSTTRRH